VRGVPTLAREFPTSGRRVKPEDIIQTLAYFVHENLAGAVEKARPSGSPLTQPSLRCCVDAASYVVRRAGRGGPGRRATQCGGHVCIPKDLEIESRRAQLTGACQSWRDPMAPDSSRRIFRLHFLMDQARLFGTPTRSNLAVVGDKSG
jgi:hypothetical protein